MSQWIYGNTGVIPAIAIPVQGKAAFECPQEHLDLLERAIWQTNRVVTIGWRGVEQRFLDLYQARQSRGESLADDLLVVSGSKEASEADGAG